MTVTKAKPLLKTHLLIHVTEVLDMRSTDNQYNLVPRHSHVYSLATKANVIISQPPVDGLILLPLGLTNLIDMDNLEAGLILTEELGRCISFNLLALTMCMMTKF
jgi:hypothetical protein